MRKAFVEIRYAKSKLTKSTSMGHPAPENKINCLLLLILLYFIRRFFSRSGSGFARFLAVRKCQHKLAIACDNLIYTSSVFHNLFFIQTTRICEG